MTGTRARREDRATSVATARPTSYPRNESKHTPTRSDLTQSASDDQEPWSSTEATTTVDVAASDLLTVMDRNGCFEQVGPLFPAAFGYVGADLVGRSFLTFVHPDDTIMTKAAMEKLAAGEPTVGLANRFRCKDASYRHVAWTAIPTPQGLLYAVAHDVTDQALQEHERGRSLIRDQAIATAHRDELLAAVCHDLQQPLTVILASTQLVQRQIARGEVPADHRVAESLTQILAAATRMRFMTQDLVDASLHAAGRPMALLLARTELVALTRQAVSEQKLVCVARQFLVEAEVPFLEATVDEARVHRVLTNLLTNAIKYSPEGGPISVTVKEKTDAAGKWALLVVRDEGVGIPPEDLTHVFDRFHRGANAARRFVGAGLGLANARELVELHGGTIVVHSEEGKGSTFIVRLPVTPRRRCSA
ncbi:MAG: hypothetical protein NVSMB2_08390 [Chloroflexota bacterium]